MPLFSIVMPTLNRAGLLRFALQSAVDQTFEDFEIILSDNSSSDNTEEVVRSFGDSRICYFRTHRVLPMPDSWEFALAKARGDWVTFLSDDDAMCPSLLEAIFGMMRNHSPRMFTISQAEYHHAIDRSRWRNCLIVPGFTGKAFKVRSEKVLSKLFAFRFPAERPTMMNTFVQKSVISDLKQRLGRFFLPPFPDYTAPTLLLTAVKDYAWLDIPLKVFGKHPRNPHAFWAEFESKPLEYTPLSAESTFNGIAESLLRAKAALPDSLAGFDLDWVTYFALFYREMRTSVKQGMSLRDDEQRFIATVRRLPPNLQVMIHLRRLVRPWTNILDVALSDPLHLSLLVKTWFGLHIFSGDPARFQNISEAARFLDRYTGDDKAKGLPRLQARFQLAFISENLALW